MVLPEILIYFGTKATQMVLDKKEEESPPAYCKLPPTAPPAEKSVNVPAVTGEIGEKKYFSGIVKDNYFYLNNRILNLSNITVLNICVCPLSETTDKTYSGKIKIMAEKGPVFEQEYNERIRWITIPGDGLDVSNSTIKVKVKSGQAVPLQYTIVYKDNVTNVTV